MSRYFSAADELRVIALARSTTALKDDQHAYEHKALAMDWVSRIAMTLPLAYFGIRLLFWF